MLEHLGHEGAARAIEAAVIQSLEEGATTPDLGGELTTAELGDRIARALL